MRKPRFFFLTIVALVGVGILVSLGVWQLQRRDWKHELMARIETRAKAEPVPLARVVEAWRKNGDVEYYHVRLTGRFLPDREFHLYSIVEGAPGWRIIAPLQTPSGDIVLVDRGFVPDQLKEPQARDSEPPAGEVSLTGLARAPGSKGWFEADNDPQGNRWYWRDLGAMAASLPAGLRERVVPFFVEAEAQPGASAWPRAGVTRLKLNDRHLEYALTWFGLAFALLAVFGFYIRSRLQIGRGET